MYFYIDDNCNVLYLFGTFLKIKITKYVAHRRKSIEMPGRLL